MSDTAIKEDEASQTAPQGNDADALFALGMRYSTGRDVEHDLVCAHKWFNLAAMMGHESALSARAELAREMAPEQIAEAQKQARAWLWSRDAPAQPSEGAEAAIVKPIYVRPQAKAMRSAKAIARICA
jgi:hypothetical protein